MVRLDFFSLKYIPVFGYIMLFGRLVSMQSIQPAFSSSETLDIRQPTASSSSGVQAAQASLSPARVGDLTWGCL
jgi:hypothetical protein